MQHIKPQDAQEDQDQESIQLPPEQTEALTSTSSDTPSDDFFISYNEADFEWAMWVADRIKQAGYSVCLPPQDFRIGFIFNNEMKKALKAAKRMVVVFSPSYLEALESRTSGFNVFKRATSSKKNILLSVCVHGYESIAKELYGLDNYIDLKGKIDEMAEAKLRAYISGKGMVLPSKAERQDNSSFPTTPITPPVPPGQTHQDSSIPSSTKKHVVLLVHGIRTRASWLEMVAANLEEKNSIEVITPRYGYFDTLQFWLPFFTRKRPIERVLREIRTAQSSHRDSHLSIIAHSFGTYAVAKILEDNPDIQIYRLILCGSVLNANFRWDKMRHQVEWVINECGTRDIWPIVAKISTWGYGDAGSFGFGSAANVKDRFHNNDHGDYFVASFVKEYWRPFIKDGQIDWSKWDTTRPDPPWWTTVLSFIPLKYIILGIILWAGWILFHR